MQTAWLPYRIVTEAGTDPTAAPGYAPNETGQGAPTFVPVIDTNGWDTLRLALDFTLAVSDAAFEVQPLWWNPATESWFSNADQSESYDSGDRLIYQCDVLGRYCYVQVPSLAGQTAESEDAPLAISYQLVKGQSGPGFLGDFGDG